MRVLIACECSGVVRDAFAKKGHDAWSCDLQPSDIGGKHYQCDIFEVLYEPWDLMIGHPPCPLLTVTANKWMLPQYKARFPNRAREREEAVDFFLKLWNAPIPKIALENPVGIMSTRLRPPDQYIDPILFGHAQTKNTGLWLKNLPLLVPPSVLTAPVHESIKDVTKLSFAHQLSGKQKKERSVTFKNIAYAMAEQWG